MEKPHIKWGGSSKSKVWICVYKGRWFYGATPKDAYNRFAITWNTANNWNNSRFPLAV